MSFFTSFEHLKNDPILHLGVIFNADPRENKVNLGIGSYKDADGKPVVFSCVREAEKILLEKHLDKEYGLIEGLPAFNSEISKLVLGSLLENELKDRVFCAQTLGGTGALRIGGELIARNKQTSTFFPEPTWPNHRIIFTYAGLHYQFYPYYCTAKKSFDFNKMESAIKKMPPGSLILLHAGCHNPTGVDPSKEEWKELSSLIKAQKLLPFFDFAYQGFGSTPEEDAFAVRHFAEQGHEMLIAVSCSKNFGLYGERTGALIVIGQTAEIMPRVISQVKQLIRGNYSMPPLHGARIVAAILGSEPLTQLWERELEHVRSRIKQLRLELASKLQIAGIQTDVSFFVKQRGIFSFTGITPEQVHRLRADHGIYMPESGRINIAGLNAQNIDYFVSAIAPFYR